MSVLSYIAYLVRKYNVEPIIFIYILARNLYLPTPLTQLVTDKLCVNQFHLDPTEFCYRINEPSFQNTTEANEISKITANYVMYKEFILSIPSIIAAIFLGLYSYCIKFCYDLMVLFHFSRSLVRYA